MRLVRLDWNSKRHNYKEAVCLFIHLNMHFCHILFVGIMTSFQLGGVIKRISPDYHIGFESYVSEFSNEICIH